MMKPMDRGVPLEDSTLEGVSGGILKKCVVEYAYICQKTECSQCGKCRGLCPAIFYEGDFPHIDPCQCNGCGKCEDLCPTGAIRRTVQMTLV